MIVTVVIALSRVLLLCWFYTHVVPFNSPQPREVLTVTPFSQMCKLRLRVA